MMKHRGSARYQNVGLGNTSGMQNIRESVNESYNAFEELLPQVNPRLCHWHYQMSVIKKASRIIEVPKLISFDYDGCVRLMVRDKAQYSINQKTDLKIYHENSQGKEKINEVDGDRKLILSIELMISFYGLVLNRPHFKREWSHFNKFTKEGATLKDLVERTKEIAPMK